MWDKALSKTDTGPRGGRRWICYICGKSFGKRECEIEHPTTVIDHRLNTECQSWDMIFSRLHGRLEIVCKGCHKVLTAEQRKLKAEHRLKEKHLVRRHKSSGVTEIQKNIKNIKEGFDNKHWEVIAVFDADELKEAKKYLKNINKNSG